LISVLYQQNRTPQFDLAHTPQPLGKENDMLYQKRRNAGKLHKFVLVWMILFIFAQYLENKIYDTKI
jgi:hypothetical protein